MALPNLKFEELYKIHLSGKKKQKYFYVKFISQSYYSIDIYLSRTKGASGFNHRNIMKVIFMYSQFLWSSKP